MLVLTNTEMKWFEKFFLSTYIGIKGTLKPSAWLKFSGRTFCIHGRLMVVWTQLVTYGGEGGVIAQECWVLSGGEGGVIAQECWVLSGVGTRRFVLLVNFATANKLVVTSG